MTLKATLTVAALSALLTCSVRLCAGDPGDLFSDIPYADKVGASPVTHQEDSLKPYKPAAPAPLAPLAPAAPPVVSPPLPQEPPAATPITQQTPATDKATHGAPIWLPYAQMVQAPLLPLADKQRFDTNDAAILSAALKGSPEAQRTASDRLFRRANRAEDAPKLQRYLYLHALGLAIRAKTPIADREKKARAVLPLLEERSLAVAQTRTECLESLATGGSVTPSLSTVLAHAYATLAELQVQTGYPKEAAASLDNARKWLEPNHPALLTAQLSATNDWVKRAETAAAELATLKAKLQNNSRDNAANTELAMIHLGLYGDLGKALGFALDSDKPELQKLTQRAKDLNLETLTADSVADAQKSLPVIAAMVDLAKSAVGPDRYLIAYHAKYRLDELTAMLPKEDVSNLTAALKKISDKITDKLDPYESLSKLDNTKPGDLSTDPSSAKKSNGSNTGSGNYDGVVVVGRGNGNGNGNGNGGGGGGRHGGRR